MEHTLCHCPALAELHGAILEDHWFKMAMGTYALASSLIQYNLNTG